MTCNTTPIRGGHVRPLFARMTEISRSEICSLGGRGAAAAAAAAWTSADAVVARLQRGGSGGGVDGGSN